MENTPNAPIVAGDVVILKSGGPRMVVEALEVHAAENTRAGKPAGTSLARCVWHDAAGAVQTHLFWESMLVGDPETVKRKADEKAAAEKRAAELSKEAEANRIAAEKSAAKNANTGYVDPVNAGDARQHSLQDA